MHFSAGNSAAGRRRWIALLALTILATAGIALAQESPVEIFEKVWREGRSRIYTVQRADSFFTDETYSDLRRRAENSASLAELTPVLNEFLRTLGVSHTHFYDDEDIDYYMFRSLFSTRQLDAPTVRHIGAQFIVSGGYYVVREVLDGYPAAHAGLRRGDIALTAGGKPFHPYRSFNADSTNGDVEIDMLRGDSVLTAAIRPVDECPHLSFYKAMQNSKRVISLGAAKVGYIHLWAGTNERILESYTEIIEQDFADCDGVILDLRGGFGGAWYDYLDPFFADRSDYFAFTLIDREDAREIHRAEAKTNPGHFAGPLVVLTNEGTRSGKEALAYQFRKSERAVLVGTTTAGAFTAGAGVFSDTEAPYLLYLAVAELLLDGNTIEGVGVEPHVHVPYGLERAPDTDPQLERALSEIERLMTLERQGD
jgi:carboxyl-terminal processing protease